MKINNKNILMYFNPYCYDNYIEDGLNELSIRKGLLSSEKKRQAEKELTERFFDSKCNYKNFLEYCID